MTLKKVMICGGIIQIQYGNYQLLEKVEQNLSIFDELSTRSYEKLSGAKHNKFGYTFLLR